VSTEDRLFQVEVTLRPTVSRPVRLGVLPLLEQVTRCHTYLCGNYFLYFSCRAPSLTRGRICNLQCNEQVQFQVTLRPTVFRPVRLGAGPITRFSFLCLTVTSSSRYGAPSPISPMNRVIYPKSKVKVTLAYDSRFTAQERTTQKTSIPILRVVSLLGK
jgi:hypothetical protein